jgi:hypothetical protein
VTRALLVVSWLTACGPGVTTTRASSEDAIVYLKSNVRDAQVFVDGRFIAPLQALGGGVAVEPGTHRLELRHEDYFSSYLELRVGHAERKKIVMNMAATLP